MSLRRRRVRKRAVLVLLAAAVILLLAAVRFRLFPIAEDLAVTRVTLRTAHLINEAIDQQISTGAVNYDRVVHLEKDEQGQVTALQTDIAEMNALKTRILAQVNREILELDVDEIGVPLGNLILPGLFSGRGPLLPVRILTVRSSDAAFENQFTQAGINQTLHQILMTVSIDMTIVTPAGTKQVEAASQVVIAETVIVGTVPDSYLSLDRPTDPESVRKN